MTVHNKICVRFKIGGRYFKAVGFLAKDETSVTGDKMLRRVHGAVGNKEDVAFLNEHREQFPAELRDYYLATAWHNPSNPRSVSYFSGCDSCGKWYKDWRDLDERCDSNVLVLCR